MPTDKTAMATRATTLSVHSMSLRVHAITGRIWIHISGHHDNRKAVHAEQILVQPPEKVKMGDLRVQMV